MVLPSHSSVLLQTGSCSKTGDRDNFFISPLHALLPPQNSWIAVLSHSRLKRRKDQFKWLLPHSDFKALFNLFFARGTSCAFSGVCFSGNLSLNVLLMSTLAQGLFPTECLTQSPVYTLLFPKEHLQHFSASDASLLPENPTDSSRLALALMALPGPDSDHALLSWQTLGIRVVIDRHISWLSDLQN